MCLTLGTLASLCGFRGFSRVPLREHVGGFPSGGGAGGLGAAETSVFLMTLEKPPAHLRASAAPGVCVGGGGAPDPHSPTRTGPDYRGGEEGSWGAVLMSPLQTYKEGALGFLWERRKFVVLGSLGDPPKIPHYFM